MTMVDKPMPVNAKLLSIMDYCRQEPGIVVINRLPDGQLEVYKWYFGQRLSIRPKTPEALWNWINHFADDHWEGLMAIGFQPPNLEERRPAAPLPNLDPDELLKDLMGD